MTPISKFMASFPYFHDPSWDGWRYTVGPMLDGLPPADVELARTITGRESFPAKMPPEVFHVKGRGTGGSRFYSVVAARAGVTAKVKTGPGERIYVVIIAPTRQQSNLTHRYTSGLLNDRPELAALITNETSDTIDLSTGISITVTTPDFRTIRGRSILLAIVEEAAFLPADNSVTPDTEMLRALRPALARVKGSQLIVVSSPYAKRGELYKAYKEHFGKNDSRTLVLQSPTQILNPSFDPEELQRAYDEDPVSAAAEYGAAFRDDISSFVTQDVIDAAVLDGVFELEPRNGIEYAAFVDASGLATGGDEYTMAISHAETHVDGSRVRVLDCLRGRKGPANSEAVTADFAALAKSYRCHRVTGDRYAGAWVADAWRKQGLDYVASTRTASEIYLDFLPALMSGRVRLLDEKIMLRQLANLERRTERSGKDRVTHPPSGNDDRINAVAGTLTADVGASAQYGAGARFPRAQRSRASLRATSRMESEHGHESWTIRRLKRTTTMEAKQLQHKIRATKKDGYAFEGWGNVANFVDTVDDDTQPGAWSKDIAVNGNKRPLLFMHDVMQPIGYVIVKDTPQGLRVVEGRLSKGVAKAEDVRCLLRDGVVDALSVGYDTIVSKRGKNGTRLLVECALKEISVVLWPANVRSRITEIPQRSPRQLGEARRHTRAHSPAAVTRRSKERGRIDRDARVVQGLHKVSWQTRNASMQAKRKGHRTMKVLSYENKAATLTPATRDESTLNAEIARVRADLSGSDERIAACHAKVNDIRATLDGVPSIHVKGLRAMYHDARVDRRSGSATANAVETLRNQVMDAEHALRVAEEDLAIEVDSKPRRAQRIQELKTIRQNLIAPGIIAEMLDAVERAEDLIEAIAVLSADAGMLAARAERELKIGRTPTGTQYIDGMPLAALALLNVLTSTDVQKAITRLSNQCNQLEHWRGKRGLKTAGSGPCPLVGGAGRTLGSRPASDR